MKILLVHWDETAGRGLRRALQRMGQAVLLATSDESLKEMLARRPDLILVPPDLIEIDGRRLFSEKTRGPLPLLMAIPPLPLGRGEPAAEQEAIDETCQRLAARVMRHLRRWIRKETSLIKVGDLKINLEEKQVLFHDQELLLTPLQFRLLEVLALRTGRVLTPAELLETVWGHEANDTEARELLKVHIRRLRRKLHAISPEGGHYIQSVRGFGYRLGPPIPGESSPTPDIPPATS